MALSRKTHTPRLFASQKKDTTTTTTSSLMINEDWINSLEEKISIPSSKYYWKDDQGDYPAKEAHSNPMALRLPWQLGRYDRLYDYHYIQQHDFDYTSPLSSTQAAADYFNFLQQYNLAYIIFLHAINDAKYIEQLQQLFAAELMFKKAGIKIKYLHEKTKHEFFLLALLAYLTLEIIFSKEINITTNARITTLKIINDHFDVEIMAQAFDMFSLGYYSFDNEENFFDMLPLNFILTKKEASGMPQNKLFLENQIIKDMFQISDDYYNKTINIDDGILTLLQKCPSEMMQVLQSLLKCYSSQITIDRATIFMALMQLIKLDTVQQEEILGDGASYRGKSRIVNKLKV